MRPKLVGIWTASGSHGFKRVPWGSLGFNRLAHFGQSLHLLRRVFPTLVAEPDRFIMLVSEMTNLVGSVVPIGEIWVAADVRGYAGWCAIGVFVWPQGFDVAFGTHIATSEVVPLPAVL